MGSDIRKILEDVKTGNMSVEEAALIFKKEPYADIDFAKIDLHRKLRRGNAEVIYGAGKSAGQIRDITGTILDKGQGPVLITRIDKDKAAELKKDIDIEYHEDANIAIAGTIPEPDGKGRIVVATGGTSDIPVAEEAALTARVLGNEVVRLYDVGVAGIHRLMDHLDEIMTANVIIAIAGMEGALASVIGGLADCPVIAVPTSVGYGASFEGLSALLSMLNSCAAGVGVVNIDNGFGAGYMASMINHR
ncbi:MAG: nickel pincer cofactor biosynthesis protein LarB [Lachnospiraceae bacterium]|nr:nickel pincer cofactor biosynthesis protein LarB [Lachnospiraceae bacterium]